MDQMSSVYVECNHCGNAYEGDFPQIVIKQDSQKFAQMIIDDEFFYFECPHCGHLQHIDLPVVYSDLEKKAIICYFNERIEFSHAQAYINEQIANFGIDREKSFVRIVSMQNELREKVILLDNELDDRVIEILKLWALERVREEGNDQKFEEMRCSVLEDGYLNIDFVGSEPMHLRVAHSYYDRLEEALRPALNQCPTPLEVSTEWALEFDVANRQ